MPHDLPGTPILGTGKRWEDCEPDSGSDGIEVLGRGRAGSCLQARSIFCVPSNAGAPPATGGLKEARSKGASRCTRSRSEGYGAGRVGN
jgi:hypothetical protein